MAATIALHGYEATVRDQQWSCDEPDLLELLQGINFGPSGASPSIANPDLYLANRAVDELGARLVRFDPFESVRGRIY